MATVKKNAIKHLASKQQEILSITPVLKALQEKKIVNWPSIKSQKDIKKGSFLYNTMENEQIME